MLFVDTSTTGDSSDAPLADLDRSGELAGAVEHRHARRHRAAPHRPQVVEHDRRGTGAGHRPVASVPVAPHRDVTDAHAGHVGDRVVLPVGIGAERRGRVRGHADGAAAVARGPSVARAVTVGGRDALGWVGVSDALRMPVVWTERHRGHAPDGGYWLGVREPGDEEPRRGDAARATAWRPAGRRSSMRPTSASIRSPPCTTPTSSTSCAAPTRPGSPRDISTEPGQPHVVRYLFATPGFAARHRRGRRPATIRAELGLYAMDTMTLMSEGTFDAAARRSTPRSTPPISSPAGSGPPTPQSARRATTPARRSSADRATSTTRPPRRSGCAMRVRAGRDRRHRRPSGQRHAGDLLGPRRRAVRQRPRRSGATAGSRTSSATPTSAAAAPARAGTTTRRSPPEAATSRGWRRSTSSCTRVERTVRTRSSCRSASTPRTTIRRHR